MNEKTLSRSINGGQTAVKGGEGEGGGRERRVCTVPVQGFAPSKGRQNIKNKGRKRDNFFAFGHPPTGLSRVNESIDSLTPIKYQYKVYESQNIRIGANKKWMLYDMILKWI